MTPPYTVVIPWADRPALEVTLVHNRPFFARHCLETIVVNTGGNREALAALLERAAVPNVRAVDLPGAAFNRSLCLNMGALQSRSELLFLLDADITLGSDVFEEAIDHLRSGSRFVAVQRILESEPKALRDDGQPDLTFLARLVNTRELVTQDGRRAVIGAHMIPGRGNGAGDGLVLVRREDMVRVGGLNSSLVGYGYEDTDFQIRLQLQLGLERVDTGEVIHLTHDSSRVDRQQWRRNYHAVIENYRHGNYLGTLQQDAVDWGDKLVALTA